MRLRNARYNRFAEILMIIGEVILATAVLPYILDKSNTLILVLGIVGTIIAFGLSLFLTKPS